MKSEISVYQLFQDIASHELLLDKIQFSSSTSFAFPAYDIRKLEAVGDKFKLEMSVLGLFGVDSPLPTYMSTIAAKESNLPWCEFVDCINDYLYRLLYSAWKKHQPLATISQKSCGYRDYVKLLAGNLFSQSAFKAYAFTDSYFSRQRNLRGLVGMLSRYFDNKAKAEVEEFAPVWQKVLQPRQLRLSDSAMLGDQVLLSGACVAINLQFDEQSLFQDAYLNKAYWQLLQTLIKKYLGAHQEFSLSVSVKISQGRPCRLTTDKIRLGFSQVVGRAHQKQYRFQLQ